MRKQPIALIFGHKNGILFCMAVEEARSFNPPDGQASQAFDVVEKLAENATIDSLRALPENQRRLVVGSYLKAALAYFANQSGDEYLEEMGTTCLQAIAEGLIDVKLARDTHEGVDQTQLSVPQKQVIKNSFNEQQLLFLKDQNFVGMGMEDVGIFIVPVGFVLEAQRDPIGSLAALSSLTSQMQDFVNGRYSNDTMHLSRPKSQATRAHFLRHAQGQNPRLEFSYQDRGLMQRFPDDVALSGLRKLQARR